jgi:hypothetical protein
MCSSKTDNSFAVPRLIGSIVAVASLYIKSDATDKREKRASHTLQSMLLGFITCFSIGFSTDLTAYGVAVQSVPPFFIL